MIIAISASLWVFLLLVLRLLVLRLLVFRLLLRELSLLLALDWDRGTAPLNVPEFVAGVQAGVVFGAAEVPEVLMENDGGNDERSDECKASIG